MKCPSCQTKHPYKSGMTCSCGYKFCLDPKADGMADGKFVGMLRRVTSNDTHFFTFNQLHAERCRRGYLSIWYGVTTLIIAAVALIAGCFLPFLFFFALIAAVVGVIMLLTSLLKGPPTPESTRVLVNKWVRKRGQLEWMITKPTLNEPPPEWKEPDIYDYGVERILVVQRDLLVDLYVRNNFHSEQRALVISASGYPSYLAPVAAKLAQQREDLPIFLLHDASESAKQMASRTARLLDVPESRMTDLGLSEEDCKRLKSIRRVGRMPKNATVPVDYLTYHRMGELTAACLVGGLVLHQVVEQQIADKGGSSFG